MNEVKVLDVVRECKGKLLCGDGNTVCKRFSKDTRTIEVGDVYLGIKGASFNGSTLYKEAFQKGASVCIVDDVEISQEELRAFEGKTIIKVEDTVKALQKLAKYKRSLYSIPVIGITGSVGKTSTKDIIAGVVSKKYKVLKTPGNLNNEIGLPLTVLQLDDHEAMVLEMGTDKFGDLELLTDIANPSIYVFTIVGSSHIANFGSRENILKGKLEMLNSKNIGDSIIMNNDNDLLHKWLLENKDEYISNGYNVYTYGIEEKSDYMAEDIRLEEFKNEYMLNVQGNEYLVDVPVGGLHFVYNSLAGVAVGKCLGMDMKDILAGIKEFELTKMRMDITKGQNNVTVINDTYNASMESMKAGIEYLTKLNVEKKLAILGDMLELGEFSESMHREVGRCAAENNIDMLITVGDEARYIADEAKKCGMQLDKVLSFEDNMAASSYIENNIELKDIAILAKASRGKKLEEIVEVIKNIIL